jgi:hypothetical protein
MDKFYIFLYLKPIKTSFKFVYQVLESQIIDCLRRHSGRGILIAKSYYFDS